MFLKDNIKRDMTIAGAIRVQNNAVAALCIVIEENGSIRTSVDIEVAYHNDIYVGIDFLVEELEREGIRRNNRSSPHNN